MKKFIFYLGHAVKNRHGTSGHGTGTAGGPARHENGREGGGTASGVRFAIDFGVHSVHFTCGGRVLNLFFL